MKKEFHLLFADINETVEKFGCVNNKGIDKSHSLFIGHWLYSLVVYRSYDRHF